MAMGPHLARVAGLTALSVVLVLYPYFPGPYDASAVAVSTTVQVLGTLMLLVVPIAVPWLWVELKRAGRRERNPFKFALAALIVGSPLAWFGTLFVSSNFGYLHGVPVLAAWGYVAARSVRGLKRSRREGVTTFNPAPLYLVVLPLALLLVQIFLAAPANEFSRSRAMSQSAELIRDIEAYRAAQGRYPSTMLATHRDYHTTVVGIEKYHYAPNGDGYDLVFEQPRLLFHDLGASEFVVYNPRDEHVIVGHAVQHLLLAPDELREQQGWFAVHETGNAHWRYFLFD
jgi:hypothetical protein